MIPDLYHLPTDGPVGFERFFGNSPTGTTNWSAWKRPVGARMIAIRAFGAGGGGGGGYTRAAGSAGGGGGGGGAGGGAGVMLPAQLVPSILYVSVGIGGAGGAASGAGAAGGNTYVSFQQSTNNAVITGSGGSGGSAGTSSGGGAIGSAGAGSGSSVGFANLVIGIGVGGAGGAQTGAVGANTAAWQLTNFLIGGAGGAGCTTTDYAGGIFTTTMVGITAPTAAAGGTGVAGQSSYVVDWSDPGMGLVTPACGGGSYNSGTAGAGGAGLMGTGGGGGGAGTTGGAGGRGGDGYVYIWWW